MSPVLKYPSASWAFAAPRAQFDEDTDEDFVDEVEEDADFFFLTQSPLLAEPGPRGIQKSDHPITTDDRTGGLDEVHQHVLNDFVDNAN
ncbi:hypothetical protein FOPE_10921 [Fonsecaea pedrosoi]|nr:hypothetical protein FOPE_10921 [Fonsecaea pedrosoi]